MTSPSTLTLGAVKDSSILNVAGVCKTSPQFTQLLNEAVQRLMDYGEWWCTVVKARVCIQRNCITWPRWVGTELAMNLCGHNRKLQNGWYDFIPLSRSDCACSGRWPSTIAAVDDGQMPVFANVPCGSANYLRAYPRIRADIGKTITFYGIDSNGQTLMTRDLNTGAWYEGETVTLAAGYVQTAAQFREVQRVQKDSTTGPVDVYQYDATNDVLLEMAHYDPGETNPMYRHATLRGGLCSSGACKAADGTIVPRTVEILAKLQFIPVSVDTDTVQIDCIPALKLMIQCIRTEESGDDDGAAKKQVMAIKELNRQLRNKLPLDQIPIHVSASGTALPELHHIGQVM